MSTSQPSGSNGPWWIPASKNGKANLITRANAILLAFVAGLVGAIFGASSSGSLFGQSINLSRTSSSVERELFHQLYQSKLEPKMVDQLVPVLLSRAMGTY